MKFHNDLVSTIAYIKKTCICFSRVQSVLSNVLQLISHLGRQLDHVMSANTIDSLNVRTDLVDEHLCRERLI